jgi:hypothetical protein
MRRLLILLVCVAALSGCGTLYYEVPAGYDVVMLDRYAPAEVKVERTVYYWLWGKYAISDDSTETAVAENHLKAARFSTTQTLWDTLLNVPMSFVTVVRRTLVIEGNR